MMMCGAVHLFLAGVVAIGANIARSQDDPTKPIRIFTSGAGGGADVVARVIAQELKARRGSDASLH